MLRLYDNRLLFQTVVFSVTKSEKVLLDLPIELAILDTAKDSQNNLIGLYNFDLTVAWAEKGMKTVQIF